MSAAAAFLQATAQALSSMSLYGAGHPMRARAVTGCHARLRALQQEHGAHQLFAFAGGEVVHGVVPLPELRNWQWAARLVSAGVQRLEFTGDVAADELERLLATLLARIYGNAADGVDDSGHLRVGPAVDAPTHGDAAWTFDTMHAEVAAMRALLAGAATSAGIAGAEAQALARALAAMRARAGGRTVPLVRLPEFDDYLVMHSLNTASLAHALAGELRLGRAGAHAACVAGLLHDVGMTRVPAAVLQRNTLDADERLAVEEHVRTGARIILESAPELEAAAVVAYEHHLLPDGCGYPRLARPRAPHLLAQLVRVCSVYSAVTSSRFHWPAWPTELALRYLESGAGREFDADAVAALVSLARQPGVLVRVGDAAEEALVG